MWRFGYDANASFILTVALVAMLGVVLVWQTNRRGKTVVVWFWAAFFGVLLGFAGTFALVRISDGKLLLSTLKPPGAESEGGDSAEAPATMDAPGGGGAGGSGGGGGGGEMGGGRGGFGAPRPKRDLPTLVRKIVLLTGDVKLDLSAEQASAVIAALEGIEQAETMSDDEAQAKLDLLLAALDETQKQQLEAIGLPRGPRPGGSGGGERPAEDANPFSEETNSSALETLRNRFQAGKEPAPQPAANK